MFNLGIRIFLCCGAVANLVADAPDQDIVQVYFANLSELQQEENWSEIIALGKRALVRSEGKELFEILDQMVSTYYRLGYFLEAEASAEALLELGKTLEEPSLLIDSLYKSSAAVRGKAGSYPELFKKARSLAEDALSIYEKEGLDDPVLKAKILFNAGAAECDDLAGDYKKGVKMYEESLFLFSEEGDLYADYSQRLMIRLGKAYFLQGDPEESLAIIEKLESENLEKRTKMHVRYLKAQVLLFLGTYLGALEEAEEGLQTARSLQAKADMQRFEKLLVDIRQVSLIGF